MKSLKTIKYVVLTIMLVFYIFFFIYVLKNKFSDDSFFFGFIIFIIALISFLAVFSYFDALERKSKKEKSLKCNEELKTANPAFHRTRYETYLVKEFVRIHKNSISTWQGDFQELYRMAADIDELDIKIELLEQAAESFFKARELFYSKGKDGMLYFQNTWEYMHNTQSNCFSYLDKITDAINEAKRYRDIVIPDVLNAIRDNEGILQKDLYKLLPHITKQEIQHQINEFANNSVITKNKKGNSYELHIVTPEDKV